MVPNSPSRILVCLALHELQKPDEWPDLPAVPSPKPAFYYRQRTSLGVAAESIDDWIVIGCHQRI